MRLSRQDQAMLPSRQMGFPTISNGNSYCPQRGRATVALMELLHFGAVNFCEATEIRGTGFVVLMLQV
jgi:hypothetical protein